MAEGGSQRHLEIGDRLGAMDGPQVDVAILPLLQHLEGMLEVARQSIDGDTKDNVDLFAPDMAHKALDPGAELVARAADSSVGIGCDQLPTTLLDEGFAQLDLRFDRDLVLAVGGVAGIKQDVLGHGLNSISSNIIGNAGRRRRPF